MSILIGLALLGAAGASGDPAVGVWSNPHGSLQVRTYRCGAQLCGTIIAASQRQIAKAQDAGVNGLVGTQIMSDYKPDGKDWAGTLFLPDRNKRVSSTLETNNGDSVKIAGCLVGRILCKSQVWTRVDGRVAQR